MSNEFPVRFGVGYDFRNPGPWRRSYEQLYQESLNQICWAEDLGFDSVWLTEHHFCDDGYTPSPLLILGAVAARTTRMRLGTNLMIAPLHDPVRLAEDVATLAILSGGRVDFGIGGGYRELEFEAFGRKLVNRPSLLEESVAIFRRAWSGTPLDFQGKRFRYPAVTVAPVPSVAPRLLMGANSEAAIERAARLADGFLASDIGAFDQYLAAVQRIGKDPAQANMFICDRSIIAEDPEATWAAISQHAVYQLNEYRKWGLFGPPDSMPPFRDGAQVLEAGIYRLFDARGAIEELLRMVDRWPQIRDISFWAQLPGEPVESGSRRLAYIAAEVLPGVRAALG
jgi:alkanesulfonate monooxygenase SsuD/methylene tetrahydromethanopterin reductase-like flavin-dependent oxidoreductase (luciferase family)